jgi:Rrf2 family protein
VHISARVDYGMRALLLLASAAERDPDALVKAETLATAQDVPLPFLERILRQLRRADLVASQRGPDGGWRLAQPASRTTVADVVRALDGPLAAVRGMRPEDTEYDAPAEHLVAVWVALRAAMRSVLEQITLDDVRSGAMPPHVRDLLALPGAWTRR